MSDTNGSHTPATDLDLLIKKAFLELDPDLPENEFLFQRIASEVMHTDTFIRLKETGSVINRFRKNAGKISLRALLLFLLLPVSIITGILVSNEYWTEKKEQILPSGTKKNNSYTAPSTGSNHQSEQNNTDARQKKPGSIRIPQVDSLNTFLSDSTYNAATGYSMQGRNMHDSTSSIKQSNDSAKVTDGSKTRPVQKKPKSDTTGVQQKRKKIKEWRKHEI